MNFFNNKKKISQTIKDKKEQIEKLKKDHNYNFEKIQLENEIKKLESGDEMINYLTNVSEILIEYDLIISQEKLLTQKSSDEDSNIDFIKLNELYIKKNELIQDYLLKTNDADYNKFNYIRTYNPMCNNCKIYLQFDENEKHFVCYSCFIIDNSFNYETSYKDNQNYSMSPKKNNPYEKISYFEDYIKKFEDSNEIIPQYILDKIINQIKIENVDLSKSGSEVKIRKILKTIGHPEYYRHRFSIISQISGKSLIIPHDIKKIIFMMFEKIQEPYIKYKPPNRRSFLSYPYILHQFFKIINLPQYSELFPLLKSEEKLRIHDEIFKKIIDDLKISDTSGIKWKFFPTI